MHRALVHTLPLFECRTQLNKNFNWSSGVVRAIVEAFNGIVSSASMMRVWKVLSSVCGSEEISD